MLKMMEDFKSRVAAFHRLIAQASFTEALEEYYDENIQSSDNNGTPIKGLTALRKAVEGFLSNSNNLSITLENSIVIDNYSAAQWRYQFIHSKIGAVDYRQISIAHWENGKIVLEQHLHNIIYQE